MDEKENPKRRGWQSQGLAEMSRTWEFVDRGGSTLVAVAVASPKEPFGTFMASLAINGTVVHLSEHGSLRQASSACESAFSRAKELRTLPGADSDSSSDDD
jgi:hypothetical protein